MRKIRDVMIVDLETLTPFQTVQDAAHRMKLRDIGWLPVCEDGTPVGTLTDRDITVRVTAEGRDPAATFVGEIMSREVVVCFEFEPWESALALMRRRQILRLPVVNRQERLVGILTPAQVARRDDGAALEGVIRSVLQPARGKA